MKVTLSHIVLLSSLAICFSLISLRQPTLVVAQSMFDVTVSPPTAYLNLLPGNQASHAITLTNTSQQELRIIPKLVDSFPADFSSVPQFGNSLTFPYLVAEKTSLDPLVIPAGGTGVLTLFFDVPLNALPAEFSLTTLFASTQADADVLGNTLSTNNSESLVTGVVASNLVIYIGEQSATPQLQITDMGTPLIVDSLRPLTSLPIVRNFGAHASIASGSATITDWRNQDLVTSQLFPMVVLSGQSQHLQVLPTQLAPSEVPAPKPLRYSSLFLLGPYQVSVSLSDASGRIYAVAESTIYALPISLIIGIAVILVLILIFQRYIRHYWEHVG